MVFFQKMGAMSSDVPILGQDFNTWFPLTMLIYVALLVLNWWERCCSRIFIANRFQFEAVSGAIGCEGGTSLHDSLACVQLSLAMSGCQLAQPHGPDCL
jgi:hypothetical protein